MASLLLKMVSNLSRVLTRYSIVTNTVTFTCYRNYLATVWRLH